MDFPDHLSPTEKRRIKKAMARGGGRCSLCGAAAYRAVLWVSKVYPERDGYVYCLCWACDRQDQTAALDALTAKREAQKEGGHGTKQAL